MGDLQKKMSELKSSRKLSSSSDSKENTPIKHAPTELEPDAERLLRMMKEVIEFNRQHRKKSTNCYNLANSSLKIVSEAF